MSSCVTCMGYLEQVVWHNSFIGCGLPFHTLIGRHCCLWCEISGDKLIVPRGERGRFPSRTVERLKNDHQHFLVEGRGDLKKAKLYNNAITEHFFNIPIDSVRAA